MLDLAVIGLGRVFERHHWPAICSSQVWRLVGACDPVGARREWLNDLRPDLRIFSDAEALFAVTDSDAVLIAATPAQHAALVKLALDAGQHILVEKPMGLDLREASGLTALAGSYALQVGYMRRFSPSYAALAEVLAELEPADIRLAQIHMSFDPIGWRSVTGYLGVGKDGDVLRDVVSHQVDLLSWLFQAECVAVHATRPEFSTVRYELELSNGVTVQGLARHAAPYREQLIVGTTKRLFVADPYGLVRRPRWAQSLPTIPMALRPGAILHLAASKLLRRPNVTAKCFVRQLDDFGARVQGRDSVGADGQSALACHRALQAIDASCKRGGVKMRIHEAQNND